MRIGPITREIVAVDKSIIGHWRPVAAARPTEIAAPMCDKFIWCYDFARVSLASGAASVLASTGVANRCT